MYFAGYINSAAAASETRLGFGQTDEIGNCMYLPMQFHLYIYTISQKNKIIKYIVNKINKI